MLDGEGELDGEGDSARGTGLAHQQLPVSEDRGPGHWQCGEE